MDSAQNVIVSNNSNNEEPPEHTTELPRKRQRTDNGDGAGPSNVHPQPQRQIFNCSLCDRTFQSSYYLKVHIDMHTRLANRQHPNIDPKILQRHLNANIETNCSICNQSVILNQMADHMIEVHVPRIEPSSNSGSNQAIVSNTHLKTC